MKNFLYLYICVLIAACTATDDKNKIVERDTSITPQNAFTNLFLDSLQVAQFIKDNNTDDSIALKINNFYNSRNYQFAWFDEKGLTEQARSILEYAKKIFR